jgi:hypothetical protein
LILFAASVIRFRLSMLIENKQQVSGKIACYRVDTMDGTATEIGAVVFDTQGLVETASAIDVERVVATTTAYCSTSSIRR